MTRMPLYEAMQALNPEVERVATLVVRKSGYRGHDAEDLRQHLLLEGWIAEAKWDSELGVPLSAYLYRRMKFAVIDFGRENGYYRRWAFATAVAAGQLRPHPLSIEEVTERMRSARHDSDVDIVGDPNSSEQFEEVLEDFDRARMSKRLRVVMERIQTKDPRAAEALRRFYLAGEQGKDIAADWGVDPGRVSQKKADGLRLARKYLSG